MCFISFGSIIEPIDVSDGTIFDVYLFSDCLNENLLFFAKPFQSIPNMLERSCIWVEQILKVWKEFIEAHRSANRKSFFVYIFGKGSNSKVCIRLPHPPYSYCWSTWLPLVGFGLRLYNFAFCFIFFFFLNILKHCPKLIYA